MKFLQTAILALLFSTDLCPAGAAPQPPRKAPRPPAHQNDPRTDPLEQLLRQAQEAIDRKDFSAAIAPLQGYLAQRPDDAAAHFQLGYVYSGLERWDEAKAEYSKAAALNPKLAAAHLNLGLVLLERDPAAAVEPFRRAAELLPDQSRPQFLLGLALERSGNPAAAIEQYQAAERLDGKNFEVEFALGRILLASGRAGEAEARFREAVALRGDSAAARALLANSLLAQKKLAGAADELAAYLKLQPDDRESRVQLASVLAKLEKFAPALAELERADAGAAPLAKSDRLRAEIYLAQKQTDRAAEALQRALQIAPRDAELHAWLGRLWLEKREFAPAEAELRRALELDANQTDALRDLVATYYLGQNCTAALEALDRLAQRETLTAGSWFVRATCYDRLGRKAEAVTAYEKFLALDQGKSDREGFQARQRLHTLQRELQKKR